VAARDAEQITQLIAETNEVKFKEKALNGMGKNTHTIYSNR
jgi:hypothetical protein